MADKKTIFVAFAIEDVTMRDFIKGQSLLATSTYEYIDMSVKEAYVEEWKTKVRTRIKRSDGVLAIISNNSLSSTGQAWELKCAKEEGKPIKGIWVYSNDKTAVTGVPTVSWTRENLAAFIDSL